MAIQRRGLIWESTVDLTAAMVRTWHTTPIEAAPAPGANRIIVPERWVLFLDAGSMFFSDAPPSNNTIAFALGGETLYTTGSLHLFFRETTDQWLTLLAPAHANSPVTANLNTPLTATANVNLAGGAILTATKGAAGLGYAANDTGTVDPDNNASATYRVLTVGALGIVVTFSITAGGYGYAVANGVATDASGAGTGFTVNITAITQGNGAIRMITRYAAPQVS